MKNNITYSRAALEKLEKAWVGKNIWNFTPPPSPEEVEEELQQIDKWLLEQMPVNSPPQ